MFTSKGKKEKEQRKFKLNIDVIAEQFEELKISIDTNIEL